MKPSSVLILPGWQDSGPKHWQSLWEDRHGYRRVEQHDWMRPLRGDWLTRLEETLLEGDEPAVLVAHSLGCQLIAAWAAHSKNTHLVKGALMVAPPDTAREDVIGMLPGWTPELGYKLPFRSVVVASQDDPFCAFGRARQFATAWGAQFIDYGDGGHLNADSGLASWPEGHVLLQDLMKD